MIQALIQAMRPYQWVKNVLVFVALVFGHRLDDIGSVQRVVLAFGVFCLLSSSIYLLNDIADRDADRAHPLKSQRPIASGALPVSVALAAAAIGMVGGLVAAWFLSAGGTDRGPPFFAVPASYCVLQIGYSFWLKRLLIVDCLCVALGFLLRVDAGSRVLGPDSAGEVVDSSDWMLLCTFFFSLLLAFSKRRSEVVEVSDGTGVTRDTLRLYSRDFLDAVITGLAAISILSYSLYTLSDETVAEHKSKNLMLTVPVVVYGVYRYLYLVLQKGEGGDPSRLLLRDRPLIVSGLAFGLVVWLAFNLDPVIK